MDFIDFIDNAALLLVLSILSINIQLRWTIREPIKKLLLGVFYGLVAAIAMIIPMELQPGVIFDGRSVVLSLAGLFTGNITTLIACLIAAAWRIYLGGSGVFTGVGSVIISGLAGLLFRRLLKHKNMRLNLGSLFLFGFIVHLILVLWFFTFPRDIALMIVRNVSLPYLIVFPLTTMLIGGYMDTQQQRLKIEENLAASEKRYRELINTLNEGVWQVDVDQITTFVNPKMAAMLGYQPEEMLGRSAFDFIAPSEIITMQRNNNRRRQGIKEQYEFKLLCKDGSQTDVQMAVTPLLDEHGEYYGSLAGVQDISELKSAQAQLADQSRHLEELVEERTHDLKDAQAQLIRAEKLATLGELAGGVGHELRNPLAVISNAVYFLKNNLPKSASAQREYVDMIEAETHNASAIISDLLDYSRIQPTAKASTDLSELVNSLIAKQAVPQEVKVENKISAEIPEVAVNAQQVEMIFTNILSNAIEAMPEGGTLKLSSRVRKDKLTIEVADSGVGIPRKNLKRIFEPLFTTKQRGIGLGLAITARLAELNDIGIRVKSREGQGTAFMLDFPLIG
jgi:PAS domain S-box-containing protein